MSRILKKLTFTRTGMMLISCLIPVLTFAQDEGEGPEPPPPTASISDWIFLAIILAVVFGYAILNKKENSYAKK